MRRFKALRSGLFSFLQEAFLSNDRGSYMKVHTNTKAGKPKLNFSLLLRRADPKKMPSSTQHLRPKGLPPLTAREAWKCPTRVGWAAGRAGRDGTGWDGSNKGRSEAIKWRGCFEAGCFVVGEELMRSLYFRPKLEEWALNVFSARRRNSPSESNSRQLGFPDDRLFLNGDNNLKDSQTQHWLQLLTVKGSLTKQLISNLLFGILKHILNVFF